MAVRKEDTPAGQMAPKVTPTPPAPDIDPLADNAELVAALQAENADLRRQVERLATVAAAGKPDEPPAKPFRVRVSEGTRNDLVQLGEVVEPGTGLLLKRDKETGEVTAWNRATGRRADVEVII